MAYSSGKIQLFLRLLFAAVAFLVAGCCLEAAPAPDDALEGAAIIDAVLILMPVIFDLDGAVCINGPMRGGGSRWSTNRLSPALYRFTGC